MILTLTQLLRRGPASTAADATPGPSGDPDHRSERAAVTATNGTTSTGV
jgi:hypothetical protein